MRSKARYNLRVGSDVLQEQGDKAKGSRGGITAVQQSCQSTARGGCTQPTVSHAASPHMKTLWCSLNVRIYICLISGSFIKVESLFGSAAEVSTDILHLSRVQGKI